MKEENEKIMILFKFIIFIKLFERSNLFIIFYFSVFKIKKKININYKLRDEIIMISNILKSKKNLSKKNSYIYNSTPIIILSSNTNYLQHQKNNNQSIEMNLSKIQKQQQPQQRSSLELLDYSKFKPKLKHLKSVWNSSLHFLNQSIINSSSSFPSTSSSSSSSYNSINKSKKLIQSNLVLVNQNQKKKEKQNRTQVRVQNQDQNQNQNSKQTAYQHLHQNFHPYNQNIRVFTPQQRLINKNTNDLSFIHEMGIPIFCLCLAGNDIRYTHCREQFCKVGILPYVRFHRPERDPLGGIHGCWMGHDAIIREAYRMNAPAVLVFEDDPVFGSNWKKPLSKIKAFLEHEPDWHMLRLGCAFMKSYDDKSVACPKHIWRIASLTTHAYILSREFIVAWVERAKFQGRGIDEDFMLATTKNYALKNAIVWQSKKFNTTIEWGKPGSTRDYFQRFIHNAVDYELWQKSLNQFVKAISYIPSEIRPLISIEKQCGVKIPSINHPALLL